MNTVSHIQGEVHYNEAIGPAYEEKLESLLDSYKEVFTVGAFGDEGPVDFWVKLTDDEPCIEPARRRPPSKRQVLMALIEKDVDLGIVETCSGSNYVAEPVLVRKKSGDWRLTIDYRKINNNDWSVMCVSFWFLCR